MHGSVSNYALGAAYSVQPPIDCNLQLGDGQSDEQIWPIQLTRALNLGHMFAECNEKVWRGKERGSQNGSGGGLAAEP